MADKSAEMLPYDLAQKIIKEQNIHKLYLRRINDRLHYFSWPDKCFVPVDADQLETAIIEYINQNPDFKIKITKRFVQETVFFINHCKLPNFQPAEYEGWMGFNNGALNIYNTFYFIDYSNYQSSFNPDTLPSVTFAFQQAYDGSIQSDLYHKVYMLQYTISQARSDKTPNFRNFLNCISGGNIALQDRVWEMIGYILSPDTNGKVFFLLQGVPNSGKSVLGRFIESFFPQGRVTSLSADRLGDRFSPAQMSTSRLNMSMDLPDGKIRSSAVANIKMITGGDLIAHEVKYKDVKANRWTCKLLFSTNHPLKLKNYDKAFLERIVCIPFQYQVPKNEQNENLLASFENEREYIINKALFAYYLLCNKKYVFSGTGQFEPHVSYVMDANEIIAAFVRECCTFDSTGYGRTSTDDLYRAYTQFCQDKNLSAVTKQGFSQRLSSMYEERIQHDKWREAYSDPENGYKGIVLINSMYTGEDDDYDDYNDSDYDDDSTDSDPIINVKTITL